MQHGGGGGGGVGMGDRCGLKNVVNSCVARCALTRPIYPVGHC